jgi:hypothetical protein
VLEALLGLTMGDSDEHLLIAQFGFVWSSCAVYPIMKLTIFDYSFPWILFAF